jgi:hypothetical protein
MSQLSGSREAPKGLQSMMSDMLAFPVAPAFEPKVGDVVENFGAIARVVDLHRSAHDGTLTGFLIVREIGHGNTKWLADPAKCRPVA